MSLSGFNYAAVQRGSPAGVTGAAGTYSAYFPKDFDGRYRISIKLQGADQCMHEVSCLHDTKILADTGNDTTLITRADAIKLGFTPETMQGDRMEVAGITDQPNPFVKVSLLMQIGETKPFHSDVGIPLVEGALYESLLGIDVIPNGKFEITYTADGVFFSQVESAVSGIIDRGSFVSAHSRCYSCFR